MSPHLARSMLSAVLRCFDYFIAAPYRRVFAFLRRKLYKPPQIVSTCSLSKHTCPKSYSYHSLLDGLPPDPSSIPFGHVYFTPKGEFISFGGSSFVNRLASGDIVKYLMPNPYCHFAEEERRREIALEAEAYRKIGKNARIPNLVDWDPVSSCLTLQYLENGSLGTYMDSHGTEVTAQQRNRWTRQAAEALAAVHAAEIIHCDVNPRNFWLDEKLDLYLGDFGGSSVAGSAPTAVVDGRFQRPGLTREPKYIDDVFALGSMLYFIQTGTEPFHDITEDEVLERFKAAEFPDVSKLDCGDIIHSCWTVSLETAQRVVESLSELYDQ